MSQVNTWLSTEPQNRTQHGHVLKMKHQQLLLIWELRIAQVTRSCKMLHCMRCVRGGRRYHGKIHNAPCQAFVFLEEPQRYLADVL